MRCRSARAASRSCCRPWPHGLALTLDFKRIPGPARRCLLGQLDEAVWGAGAPQEETSAGGSLEAAQATAGGLPTLLELADLLAGE